MNPAAAICDLISTAAAQAQTVTRYRPLLVGFASAHDKAFVQMKQTIGPHHLHPREMLDEAGTVVAFFLPFAASVVETNRESTIVSREWAVAYIETNRLVDAICTALQELLAADGIKSAAAKATHNFDQDSLEASWSHKSAAYAAGLGTFGVNQMLITPAGCAGRCGSLVIAAKLKPTPRPRTEFCRHKRKGGCLTCLDNCPTGALQADGLNKQRCYRHLLDTAAQFPDLGLCDVCGKCAIGPCAFAPC